MEKLKVMIENYMPVCEQEEADKKLMLEYIENFSKQFTIRYSKLLLFFYKMPNHPATFLSTQLMKQLQQDFKAITDIPAGAVTDTWKNYQLVVEQFYDRLKMNKELRDLDFKKNLEAKRALIDEAKALESLEDVVDAFKKLQQLHDQWREIGPVSKEYREDVWNEFKDASTVINKRHQEFFESRKEAEKANEDAKTALCEEIETINIDELKTFSAWDEATKKIIELQERWKTLGFASRKVNNALFARFRKTCDEFFNRKAEYFKNTKETFA